MARFRKLRTCVLLEAGAAVLFFGILAQHPELDRCATGALSELKTRGYEVPEDSNPVRIYPARTQDSFRSNHAGGWRPGVISLRENPRSDLGPEVYLRHELMHEACFRTCTGSRAGLPLWAEEAAAMDFSGELAAHASAGRPLDLEREIDRLRRRVRIGAGLDQGSYRTLAALVAAHGWPGKPCAVSDEIQRLLVPPGGPAGADFSAILISLASGRVLESKGDLETTRHPPGSLLKVVYAAALRDTLDDTGGNAPIPSLPFANGDREGFGGDLRQILRGPALEKTGESGLSAGGEVGSELAASDTIRLLRRRTHLDLDRYRFLISVAKDSVLGQQATPEEQAEKRDGFFRTAMGERDEAGEFPFEANLKEIALILRSSLLYRPGAFRGLAGNGFVEGTTLFAEPEADKQILRKLCAMSKTGTVSDERGVPIVGHLMVAWPADDPVFLAVFRSAGLNGAGNLRRASSMLDEWSSRHPADRARVRVRILTLAPRDSWEILDECPSFESTAGTMGGRANDMMSGRGWKRRVSSCGSFRILSSSRKSRSERLVAGVLDSSPDEQVVVLETDAETYGDAVLTAEAEDLEGEALKALRAVIVWNGTHPGDRHPDSASLCDSTHCMVFLGSLPDRPAKAGAVATNPALLNQLDTVAARKGMAWLPFSKGGVEKWEKQIGRAELEALVNEPFVLDLRRERTRKGAVMIHLFYADNEETISCEVFRNSLKLLSCPEIIRREEIGGHWIFQGIGEGHGLGLSVERARTLARSGCRAAAILSDAYE